MTSVAAPSARPRIGFTATLVSEWTKFVTLRSTYVVTGLTVVLAGAQACQHDRQLLLRCPRPVLPLLAQPCLLVGRAAHPEPAAGRSLRRYAPPGSSGNPSQLPVNAGPGSGAITDYIDWRNAHRDHPKLRHLTRRIVARKTAAPDLKPANVA